MAGVKGKSGGKRKGAGRKEIKKNHSEDVKNGWLSAIELVAKEKGRTYQEEAVRMIYDENVQGSVRASIIKTISETLVVRTTSSESNVNINDNRPKIYTPKRKPDPALAVVAGGK